MKKKKKKTDYKPIKLTESEYRNLAGIEESKRIPKYVEHYLYKWNINIPCKPSEEIGYCYQYRKYLKMWFFLLSFVPFSLCRFLVSLWDYGLRNYSPLHRLIAIYEIKDGDEACNGIFNDDISALIFHEDAQKQDTRPSIQGTCPRCCRQNKD